MALSKILLIAAVVGAVAAENKTTVSISVPSNKTTVSISVPSNMSTRVLAPDVYGYSIEPVWLDSYISTSLASTLLGSIANVTGKAPPIRIGGNTADQTYLYPSSPLPLTGNDSVAIPDPLSAKRFNITPHWFDTWATYFPAGTDLIYTLNLADNSSSWANAVAEAAAAHAALGDSLAAFELGNEIDHFINKGWRDASWGVETYIAQFRNLTGQITGSEWYQALAKTNNSSSSSCRTNDKEEEEEEGEEKKKKKRMRKTPTFQAAVFADPPLVPDQQDETDDFSIANLTAAGIASRPEDERVISSYATHLYPQSTCDSPRWHRMRLDLLSDHAVLWANVSQYIPQVAAADAAGRAPLVMGETNSVSCSGRSGISDTFGAALWGVDYVLTAASIGFRKVYFHLGAQSEYSAFTPLPYELKNETLAAGIRAGWYAHYFLARVVSDRCRGGFRVAALPSANSSELSGFAVYGGQGHKDHSEKKKKKTGRGRHAGGEGLRKLVFLDMGVWNGTEGLGNPSTLAATDGTMFSEGTRPVSTFEVMTPWAEGAEVKVLRLAAPGTNAKSNVTVAGTVFDDETGEPVVGGDALQLGDEYSEIIQVGAAGVLKFDVQRAEAVLLEVGGGDEKSVDCAGGGENAGGAEAGGAEDGDDDDDDDSQDRLTPGISGTLRAEARWENIIAVLVGVVGILAL
ncbi:glycoside hydrolase superfamily [Ustulina deusta]|nr:glycoside hydrolase superfamily [Ustulina deusta]